MNTNSIKSSAKPFSKQEKWKQTSETREKFSFQFALQNETFKLLNPELNTQYVKLLHTKSDGEILKVLNRPSMRIDSVPVHNPVGAYNYGLFCLNNFSNHNIDIQMYDTEYSRQIDPYLSITTKDFCSIKRMENDSITIWNWKAHKNTASYTDRSTITRTLNPPLKKVFPRNYLSETLAKFESFCRN